MTICTNSVVHYTKGSNGLSGVDVLKHILMEGFIPKCCKEMILKDNEKIQMNIPEVSFCDIPFSQISDHVSAYGSYAIGLTKDWARLKGLNPVIYIIKDSIIQRVLIDTLQTTANIVEAAPNVAPYGLNLMHSVKVNLSFFKYESAPLYRKGELIEDNYLYYKEREWRYVVDSFEFTEDIFFEEQETKIQERNEMLKDSRYRLNFQIEDISYIIVEREIEIHDMVSFVKKFYKDESTKVDILLTKIKSMERIKSDY